MWHSPDVSRNIFAQCVSVTCELLEVIRTEVSRVTKCHIAAEKVLNDLTTLNKKATRFDVYHTEKVW